MTPVIVHLRNNVPELPSLVNDSPLHWTFSESIKELGPDFYKNIVLLHPVLNLEYSILCNQLRHNLLFPHKVAKDQVIEQLKAALMLAELLEQAHLFYLDVPREVLRLRRHQRLYKTMLSDMAGYTFIEVNAKEIEEQLSLSQYIRDNVAQTNWYRLLITRTKRLLNLLDVVDTGLDSFRGFVRLMDQYTNPFFAYLAWCFFIPRLTTNLFLLMKHLIPGAWMGEQEKDLGWFARLQAQLQRRWFELGNDLVWVIVGLLNCFVLVGGLAPVAFYFTLFGFAFDVANASLRAYVELNRLQKLKEEYDVLYQNACSDEERKAIKDYQHYINHRIEFEKLRLGLHTAGTIVVFLGVCLSIPFFALNPVLPLIGAVLIILTWIATFTLTSALEQYRPNDNVEKPSGVVQFGLFARKNDEKPRMVPVADELNTSAEPENDEGMQSTLSNSM